MNTEDIDKLWQLAYKAFNRPNEALRMAAIIGGTQASNEVGHRILAVVSAMKHGDATSASVGSLRADILLAEANSWIPNDTAESMQTLLDTIELS
jgi:hypothetical protein